MRFIPVDTHLIVWERNKF